MDDMLKIISMLVVGVAAITAAYYVSPIIGANVCKVSTVVTSVPVEPEKVEMVSIGIFSIFCAIITYMLCDNIMGVLHVAAANANVITDALPNVGQVMQETLAQQAWNADKLFLLELEPVKRALSSPEFVDNLSSCLARKFCDNTIITSYEWKSYFWINPHDLLESTMTYPVNGCPMTRMLYLFHEIGHNINYNHYHKYEIYELEDIMAHLFKGLEHNSSAGGISIAELLYRHVVNMNYFLSSPQMFDVSFIVTDAGKVIPDPASALEIVRKTDGSFLFNHPEVLVESRRVLKMIFFLLKAMMGG